MDLTNWGCETKGLTEVKTCPKPNEPNSHISYTHLPEVPNFHDLPKTCTRCKAKDGDNYSWCVSGGSISAVKQRICLPTNVFGLLCPVRAVEEVGWFIYYVDLFIYSFPLF